MNNVYLLLYVRMLLKTWEFFSIQNFIFVRIGLCIFASFKVVETNSCYNLFNYWESSDIMFYLT
jgi:hypothetical protein